MCGLTGFISRGGHRPSSARAIIAAMAGILHHRGPDGRGVWADDAIALGHTRLAILDISPDGTQPMLSQDERHVLVFNGEIYNHHDLRRSLAKDGADIAWRGHSDTETLLEAISFWGIETTLRASEGMFALALWDRKLRTLKLARDRVGEKPLYWGIQNDTLIFGSELKGIRQHPNFSSDVDESVLSEFLRFGYIRTPHSIYRNIKKVAPGCILEIGLDKFCKNPEYDASKNSTEHRLIQSEYWSVSTIFKNAKNNPLRNFAAASVELEALLTNAVAKQSIADVPLGAFLSGGVDSSLIVALMQANSGERAKTFTIGFDDSAFDESENAQLVADHLGTDHHKLLVTVADARDLIPRLPTIYDEPFADSSQIPTFFVSQAARQHVTVALSGDGADELFGGYNRYIWGPSLWENTRWAGKSGRKIAAFAMDALPDGAWDRVGDLLNRLRSGASGVDRLSSKVRKVAEALRSGESLQEFYESVSGPKSSISWLRPEFSKSNSTHDRSVLSSLDVTKQMMLLDFLTYLPDDVLCKVDRAAMANSLETRAPFLDHHVIAFAARLPQSMITSDGVGKLLLRDVLYRHVPKSLIERPKRGFSIPLGAWLREELRPWAEDLLQPVLADQDRYFEATPVRSLWEAHQSGRRDFSAQLWPILMFQGWQRG